MGLWECTKDGAKTQSRHKNPACPSCHKKKNMIEIMTPHISPKNMTFKPFKAAISGSASAYFGKKYVVKDEAKEMKQG